MDAAATTRAAAARRRAREDGRERGARAGRGAGRERQLLDDAAAQQQARAAARQAARAKIAAEREERERRERADAAAKAERGGRGDAKRAATRRDLAAARQAEARTALERRNEQSRIFIDVANVGHWNVVGRRVTFNWDQVAEVFQYYKERASDRADFCRFIPITATPCLELALQDASASRPGRDGERDVDDRFLLHQSKEQQDLCGNRISGSTPPRRCPRYGV